MLAGAGDRHLMPGLLPGLLPAIALLHPLGHLVVIQGLLEVLSPVGRADHRRQAGVVASVDHVHQRVIAALVDLQSVGQGH